MANEKMKPQSPEEIARAAQEAVLEQMRAMMGSIPGMPGMPDMGDMQAQIMAQMQAAVPDLAEIQAQQAAMGTLGGVDAAAVAEAARHNMAQAAATMQAMQDGSLEKELREANAAALDWLGEDDGWEIKHAATCRLKAEQMRLMALAAPLLVYNDEAVDAVESEVLPETYRAQLQSWWNITDRDSTLEIVRWLLHEGHHADADAALALMRGDQSEAGDPEEKAEDVQLIAEFMIRNGYCTAETLPQTVIAWDLVRIANLGRWALHAGYLSKEEMWQVMPGGRRCRPRALRLVGGVRTQLRHGPRCLARRRGGLPDGLGDRHRAARRGDLAVAADPVERIAPRQRRDDGTGT